MNDVSGSNIDRAGERSSKHDLALFQAGVESGQFVDKIAIGPPATTLAVPVSAAAGAPGAVADPQGKFTGFMASAKVAAMPVRPDFDIFGAADGVKDVYGSVESLRSQLGAFGIGSATQGSHATQNRTKGSGSLRALAAKLGGL